MKNMRPYRLQALLWVIASAFMLLSSAHNGACQQSFEEISNINRSLLQLAKDNGCSNAFNAIDQKLNGDWGAAVRMALTHGAGCDGKASSSVLPGDQLVGAYPRTTNQLFWVACKLCNYGKPEIARDLLKKLPSLTPDLSIVEIRVLYQLRDPVWKERLELSTVPSSLTSDILFKMSIDATQDGFPQVSTNLYALLFESDPAVRNNPGHILQMAQFELTSGNPLAALERITLLRSGFKDYCGEREAMVGYAAARALMGVKSWELAHKELETLTKLAEQGDETAMSYSFPVGIYLKEVKDHLQKADTHKKVAKQTQVRKRSVTLIVSICIAALIPLLFIGKKLLSAKTFLIFGTLALFQADICATSGTSVTNISLGIVRSPSVTVSNIHLALPEPVTVKEVTAACGCTTSKIKQGLVSETARKIA